MYNEVNSYEQIPAEAFGIFWVTHVFLYNAGAIYITGAVVCVFSSLSHGV